VIPQTVQEILGYAGLSLLSTIFLANGLGVIDPRRAAHELRESTLPAWLVGPKRAAGSVVAVGRVVQIAGVVGLFIPIARPFAALVLCGFLSIATLAAHPFWKSPAEQRGSQFADFLKNVSIMGGLLAAAAW